MVGDPKMGCWVFLPSLSRHGYRALSEAGGYDSAPDDGNPTTVTVVVGKERRVFSVDPFVLEEAPFRVLMEMVSDKAQGSERERERKRRRGGRDDVIFVDVDAILFEYMLWLVYNDRSASDSLFQLNLKEIIEFYSQDS